MDYLVQSARDDYAPHLELVRDLHTDYAQRHGLSYIAHTGAMLPKWTGHWDMILLLLYLVRRNDTGFVMWVDADALIVGDREPREALGDCVVGMTRHPGPPEHYNCGVLFLRACAEVKAWLCKVLDNGPGVYPWYQQNLMNEYLGGMQVKTLPHEWNSTVILHHPQQCCIVAWHGYPGGPRARLREMENTIAKL